MLCLQSVRNNAPADRGYGPRSSRRNISQWLLEQPRPDSRCTNLSTRSALADPRLECEPSHAPRRESIVFLWAALLPCAGQQGNPMTDTRENTAASLEAIYAKIARFAGETNPTDFNAADSGHATSSNVVRSARLTCGRPPTRVLRGPPRGLGRLLFTCGSA